MRYTLLAVVALIGCRASDSIVTGDTNDDDTNDVVEVDDSAVFDPEHILEVEITMPEQEWDELRQQARSFGALWAGEDCMDQPFESPYSWFSATVTLDGDTLPDVGVRKKGFYGSVEPDRPSLKLDFDSTVEGREWMGVSRLTLNNNRQDATRVATCMGYSLFHDAGLPASRCNFAHVTVNGVDLGIYSNVEPIKKPMLRRVFGSDTGTLAEGTISDFRDGWLGTFELETAESEAAPLDALAEALTVPDDQLVAALDGVVDLDQFIDYWVMESLIGHWDGYAGNRNNYWVYADPAAGGRLRFIPWGVDAILTGERPFALYSPWHPVAVVANGTLAYRAIRHPDLRERFVDRMRATLATVWDEDAIEARRQHMLDLISERTLPNAERAAASSENAAFIARRQGQVEAELARGWTPLPGDWPEFNNCQVEVRRVTATFETTWGSTDEGPPWSRGTGTIEMTELGERVEVEFLGTTAGPWRTDEIIAISGRLPTGGEVMFIATAVDDRALFETGEHKADGTEFSVIMTRDDNGGHDSYGFVGTMSGTLTLDAVSETAGGRVVGTLDAAAFARR